MAVREQSRRRAAAALIAITAGVVALVATLSPAASATEPAARAAAATPVSTTSGKTTLQVDPAAGINPVGGTITVSGSGFDPTSQLYVAVCRADGKAPADLTECVGGAVPAGNRTQAWAYVTTDGAAPPQGGGVAGRWANDGSFSLGLVLPTTSGGIDCLQAACAVYTTEPAPGTGSRLSIPLTFAAAAPSSPSIASTTESPTTESPTTGSPTSGSSNSQFTTTPSGTASSTISPSTESSTPSSSSMAPPSTVAPKSVKSASIMGGGTQQITFDGFIPGETVSVTLFSAPIRLPEVTTDAQGVVTVDFAVPKTLPVGTHIVQAIGATSHNTGIARFVVTAPVVPTTTASGSPSSAPSSTRASSAVSSTNSAAVTTSSIALTPSTAVTTGSAIGPPAANPKPVWPWYVLGLIVLICLIIGFVAVARRRSRLAAENIERNRVLSEAAVEQQYRAEQAAAGAEAPTTYLGPYSNPAEPPPMPAAGYRPDAHGLLSGRENAEDPGLLSGQGYEPPPPEAATTQWSLPDDDDDGDAPSGSRPGL